MPVRMFLAFAAIAAAFVCSGLSAQDACYVVRGSQGQIVELDLGQCDTVSLVCPVRVNFGSISIGDTIRVPIRIWNDDRVAGLSLGFKQNGTSLRFVANWEIAPNGIIPLPAWNFKTPTRVSADGDTIMIGWVDFTGAYPIPPAQGDRALPLGDLLLVVESEVSQVVSIDSTFVPPAGRFNLVALHPPVGSFKLVPQYSHCGNDIFLGVVCGDVDASMDINMADAVYLVNYIFADGPEPLPFLLNGDEDCSDDVNISDVVYLVNYMFWSGAPPCAGC